MFQIEPSAGGNAQHGNNNVDQLSQDADRAENLIRSLMKGDHVDTDLAKQLHGDLVKVFSQMVEDTDEISASEIALAIWRELLRIEELMIEAEESDAATKDSMEEFLDNLPSGFVV